MGGLWETKPEPGKRKKEKKVGKKRKRRQKKKKKRIQIKEVYKAKKEQ